MFTARMRNAMILLAALAACSTALAQKPALTPLAGGEGTTPPAPWRAVGLPRNKAPLAMKHGLGLNKILGTIHTYPTLSEANKYAAGEWKRAHQPHGLLKWVGRYHDWKRR